MFRYLIRMHLLSSLQLPKLVMYLPQFVRVFYRLMHDPRVPRMAKLAPLVVLLPMFSPPALRLEFIPVLGLLGWLVVISFAMKLFVWLCPPEVVREHVARIARGG